MPAQSQYRLTLKMFLIQRQAVVKNIIKQIDVKWLNGSLDTFKVKFKELMHKDTLVNYNMSFV